jgi:sugar O-acyltransferase (sialic acid O-acetyltransferase NeuD family)
MHIIGASGHGKVIIDILLLNNKEISGIWDDNHDLETFCGYRLSGSITALYDLSCPEIIIAIGNNKIRKNIASILTPRLFGMAIHPTSIISRTANISTGTVIMANVVVNADAEIGKHVILNTSCSIDHDCIIDDFVHISPQAGLAGNVIVGEGTHIGIGANIIQGIKIGKWATIGAGAVVIRDVPDYAVVVGNPGKLIKYNSI